MQLHEPVSNHQSNKMYSVLQNFFYTVTRRNQLTLVWLVPLGWLFWKSFHLFPVRWEILPWSLKVEPAEFLGHFNWFTDNSFKLIIIPYLKTNTY